MDRYERRVLVITAMVFALSVLTMVKAADLSFGSAPWSAEVPVKFTGLLGWNQ
jgi:hypothetical protein